MNNNYWYGKNVFITGINGFIGGNLAKILVQKGQINCQYMDYEKVLKYFNWHPENLLDVGLDKTIKWYKKWNNTNTKVKYA